MAKKRIQQAAGNPPPTPPPPPTLEVLTGTDSLPANVDLVSGGTVQLGDIVRRAYEDSGLDVAAWNALSQEDRDTAILAARDLLAEDEIEEEQDLIECAVLHDSIYGKHNEIIRLTVEHAAAAEAAGYVDSHPNAIKAIREPA